MGDHNDGDNNPKASLRRSAEARVRQAPEDDEAPGGSPSAENAGDLLQEIRVLKAALDIQGEQLAATRVELADAHARIVDLYDFAPTGYLSVAVGDSIDQDSIDKVNPAVAWMLGLSRDTLLHSPFEQLVCEPDHEIYAEHRRALVEQAREHACELRLTRAGGGVLYMALRSVPVRNKAGKVDCIRSSLTDISALKKAELLARQAEAILRASDEGLAVLDLQGFIVRINPAFTRLTDFDWSEVEGRRFRELLMAESNGESFDKVWSTLRRDEKWRGDLSLKCGTVGSSMIATTSLVVLPDQQGHIAGYAAMFRDVTELRRAEAQLWQRANYDALTRLPNRDLFAERLAQAITEATRHQHLLAVLYIDVDKLKFINDNYGHAAGDAALREVANRLTDCVRAHDTVARISGDEFAVVLGDVDQPQDVVTVVDKMLARFAEPITVGEQEVIATQSIGIALCPVDAADGSTLCRYADLALYRAKAAGGNCYSFFTDSMTRAAQSRAHMKHDLERALRADEFQMYYQPMLDAASGQLTGAEALLRWKHPQRGLLRPEPFLKVAEETGQMLPLGAWIIQTVDREWSQLMRTAADPSALSLSINLSPSQLHQGSAFDQTMLQLHECSVAPARITLEITESMALNSAGKAREQLAALKALGVSLAMDDFGTGYSSLGYLRQLPFDILKIDRSFIHGLTFSDGSARLVQAIVEMAHALDIKVVAEGVETTEQLNFVREHGCDFIQGFLISPPVSGDTMRGFLEQGLRLPVV